MEQMSLIEEQKNSYLVDIFSADNFCNEDSRKFIEKKYSSKLEITDKFNRKSVSYQLSKKRYIA